jgi:predicted O-methyltransferase YrrM
MLIVMERDPARAVQMREKFRQTGLAERAAVIVGDPRRMLHKLAGPFDVIFLGPAEQDLAIGDKLSALLKPGGQLIRGQTP